LARLVVLVDNEAPSGLTPAWGLSILAETREGSLVLFDTGPDAETLCANAERLGAARLLQELDLVVISHPHRDHYGGLACIAHHSPGTRILLPPTPSHIVSWIRRLGLTPVTQAAGGPVAPGAYASPALTAAIALAERALAVQGEHGVTVLLGCSHPGGDRLTEAALQAAAADKAYLVIGGLHNPPPEVVDRIAQLAEHIAPIHCSGQAKQYAKTRYPDKYIEAKAGTQIQI